MVTFAFYCSTVCSTPKKYYKRMQPLYATIATVAPFWLHILQRLKPSKIRVFIATQLKKTQGFHLVIHANKC